MNDKILVIDDEEALCEILRYNLEKEGYRVDTAYSAEEALELNLKEYALFIVDIMMYEMSGFDFAAKVREMEGMTNVPILFCSALSDEDNVVKGLNIGADDYVRKPFVISEVLARVRAVLRRSYPSNKIAGKREGVDNNGLLPDLVFEGLRLDRNEMQLYINDEPVSLTRTEFDLLLYFMSHPNCVHSRESIIKAVWGEQVFVTSRTIDTNLNRLRKKLGDYEKYIVTRPGFGYGFKEKV